MPSRLEDRKKAYEAQEVCERMFTCNCFVTDGLAALRQAERTRQPKPRSNFQIRRKDETHRLNKHIGREDFKAGEHTR
jgi:hypothetical protein